MKELIKDIRKNGIFISFILTLIGLAIFLTMYKEVHAVEYTLLNRICNRNHELHLMIKEAMEDGTIRHYELKRIYRREKEMDVNTAKFKLQRKIQQHD